MSASPRHPQTTITSRFYNFARLTMFNHCKPMKTRQKIPLLQPFDQGRVASLPQEHHEDACFFHIQAGWDLGSKPVDPLGWKKKCQTSAIPWSFCCGNCDNWELEPFQILLTSVPRFVGTQKSNSVRFCLVVTFRNQKIDFDQNCLLKKRGI